MNFPSDADVRARFVSETERERRRAAAAGARRLTLRGCWASARPKKKAAALLDWARRKRETGLAARTSVGGGFHFSFLFSRILNQPFQKEFETLFKSYKNQSNIIKYA